MASASIRHIEPLLPAVAVNLQFQYPNADLATTGWTPTPSTPTTLYDKVDETTPSDTDYISSTAT